MISKGLFKNGGRETLCFYISFQNLKPDTSADRWHSSRSSHRATFGSLPLPKGPSLARSSIQWVRYRYLGCDLPIYPSVNWKQSETNRWNNWDHHSDGSSLFRSVGLKPYNGLVTDQWVCGWDAMVWFDGSSFSCEPVIYIIGSPACGWSCVECEPSHLRGKHEKNGMGSTHTLGFGWVSPRCLTGGWTPQAPLYENMQRLILYYLSWDNLTQSLENWGSHQKRMNHCLDMLATRETITPSGRHGQHHHSKHQLVWATCLPKPLQLEAVPFSTLPIFDTLQVCCFLRFCSGQSLPVISQL